MWCNRKFSHGFLHFLQWKRSNFHPNRYFSLTEKRALMQSPVFYQSTNLPARKMTEYYGASLLLKMLVDGERCDRTRITPETLNQAIFLNNF